MKSIILITIGAKIKTYMDMNDRYRLRNDNSTDMEKVIH
jgi:hypothetical protein